MIFVIHVQAIERDIDKNMGLPEYSYFFVMKHFRPLLERFGFVIEAHNGCEVDAIYRCSIVMGEQCIFLDFSPPNKLLDVEECPTVPVFAWEYSTIPSEIWGGNPKNDWSFVLGSCAAAITHSGSACEATRDLLGDDYPIVSIAAPLWDKFSIINDPNIVAFRGQDTVVEVDGWVLDTNESNREKVKFSEKARANVRLSGVVYTSVFNPNDGRKNWAALLHAFCWTFREVSDATLVLKLVHFDPAFCYEVVYSEILKAPYFKSRVIVIHGFLDEIQYARLIRATSFIVNSAYGEGQCLPLMEFMSAGVPAIAPCHTGMADYVNNGNSFIVESSKEPIHWPHDPRLLIRTFRERVNWGDLCVKYMASYQEVKYEPASYQRRSIQSMMDLEQHCSVAVAVQKVKKVIVLCERRMPDKMLGRKQRIFKHFYKALWHLGWITGTSRVLEYGYSRMIKMRVS